jgi:endonuclease/exonuclease/phosphatase family metal-dependent hydrolase
MNENDFVEMQALTFNIFGSSYWPQTKRRMQQMGESLVNLTDELGLDFITLQETFFNSYRDELIVKPWQERFHHHSYADQKKWWQVFGSGLTTLSRHEIIHTIFEPYKTSKVVDAFSNKGILLTRIKLPTGVELDLYNTHTQASYINPKGRNTVRERQIEQLSAFIQKESDGSRPILLMGDLNTTEDHHGYKKLVQEQGKLANESHQFKDIMRRLFPDRLLHPLTTLIKSNPLQERKLDHVFLRTGHRFEWDRENTSSELYDFDLSDHRAILSRISLQKVPAYLRSVGVPPCKE